MAAAASKDLTLPPTTAGRAMTANFMPGKRISAPYTALPMVMSRRSTILVSPLRMSVNSSGVLKSSVSRGGTGSAMAASASSPKPSFFPVSFFASSSCTT